MERSTPASLGRALRIIFLPGVRGHTFYHHWEQNHKENMSSPPLKNPTDQRSPMLNGSRQNVTFISELVCISMRNQGALGPSPCPPSAVPNVAIPANSVPSSCDSALGGPPFPWCSCSSPVPEGCCQARSEHTRRRRPKPGRCNRTGKDGHLLLISMGKFP